MFTTLHSMNRKPVDEGGSRSFIVAFYVWRPMSRNGLPYSDDDDYFYTKRRITTIFFINYHSMTFYGKTYVWQLTSDA